MNALESTLRQAKEAGRKVFIPFLTAGDPDLGFTERLVRASAEAGADVIEVGFPFSDPIADGPVIQASYTRALNNGVKVAGIFDMCRRVSSTPGWSVPLVGMVSYTLVHRRGVSAFTADAAAAGLSGLIVPDMPPEEGEDLLAAARDTGLCAVLLVTPTTSPERAERILARCSGFVYCVSIVGITGEREAIPEKLRGQLAWLRSKTDLPLCVGFGVSRPEQARQLREFADGVIVGSALVRRAEQHAGDPDAAVAAVRGLVGELAAAVHGE